MGRAGSGRDRWLLGAKLLVASAAFTLAAQGCGAATDISDVGDFGQNLGGSTNGTGGQSFGGGTVIAVCGNGQLDQGEACDGPIFRGETCASVTSGAMPQGFLNCSVNCQLDLTNCYGSGTGGAFNAGGSSNAGGFIGAGGSIGGGGFGAFGGFGPDASVGPGGGPFDYCYTEGGVPDPSGSGICEFGDVATKACLLDYQQVRGGSNTTSPSCGYSCACQPCAVSYDRCTALAGCLDHLDCLENSCGGLECANCAGYLQGATQYTAMVVSNALSCLSGAGCAPACGAVFE